MYWPPASHHYSDPLSTPSYDHEIGSLNRDFKKFIDAVQRIDHPQDTAKLPMVFGVALEPDSQGRPKLHYFGMEAEPGTVRRPYVKIIEDSTDHPEKKRSTSLMGYHLIFEMPGVKKEELDIQTRGRFVTVRAQGKTRRYASKIRLPDGINPSVTTAAFENGILTLQLRFLKPQPIGHTAITIE